MSDDGSSLGAHPDTATRTIESCANHVLFKFFIKPISIEVPKSKQ